MDVTAAFTDFIRNFKSLEPARRWMIIGAGALTLLMMGTFIYFTNQVDYQVLFSGLAQEDTAVIVGKLQEKKIPYKVSPSGDIIYAPADKVPELRMEMAAAGALRGGTVGYEIFDSRTLGATEFEQQINYRRALQGELARTINSLDEVQQSRVHIAIPKDSLFTDQQKKATASVTIKLKPGRTLRPGQIEGITHLVARSVEGLIPDDVIVIDSKGNILSKNQGEARLTHLSNTQIEYQRNVEKELAAQVQTLLENVVGKGKAVVRVTADLDFRVSEKTEEIYDPESTVVRSSQKQSEKTTTPTGKASTGGQEREKVDEVVNYEINKVVNKTVMPVGDIKKLSIAVLVDGLYVKNDKGQEVYQERSKKDLETIEDLVRKSAGFNAARGDQVVVTSMPFTKMDTDTTPPGSAWQSIFYTVLPLVKYVVIAAAMVLFFVWVIRPLIRVMTLPPTLGPTSAGPVRPTETAPPTLGGGPMPSLLGASSEQVTKSETELIRQLAQADPKRFAELLRNWVQ